MKTRMFLIAAAMMIFATLGFGQPFIATIYSTDAEFNNFPLYENCDGTGGFLAAGTMMYLFQDTNGNGPDAADPQPPVCGEVGCVNWNSYPLDWSLGEGTFYTDPSLVGVEIPPIGQRGFYFRIYCDGASGGPVQYVSEVFQVVTGPQEIFIDQWTCDPNACDTPPPSCDPTVSVELTPNMPIPGPQSASACVQLSDVAATTVYVPVTNSSNIPTVTATPGCANDPSCAPAAATFGPWTYSALPAPHFFAQVFRTGDGCCATLTLEYILSVQLNGFAAVAGDNAVTVNWATASETNNSHFDLLRDGAKVAEIASEGSSVGHDYSFVDEHVVNGTTYTYTLVAVDVNGGRTELATASATPSFGAAVITEYALHQNFPNPFNPSTAIAFDVVEKNLVTMKIFNANGQEVATVANGEFNAGRHVVNFDATNLTSGLYFYTVKIGNEFSATKKMLMVK